MINDMTKNIYYIYKILKSAIFDVFVDGRYHIHDEERFVVNCVLE